MEHTVMKRIITTMILTCTVIIAGSCKKAPESQYVYTGDMDLYESKCLNDKKIFIDPGHGGNSKGDERRVVESTKEEDLNLKVALILADMLEQSGATVKLSRKKGIDVPLLDRVSTSNKFKPDLLISIHHNIRQPEDTNYPYIMISRTKQLNPQSYDAAKTVLAELEKFIGVKGYVISDMAVYPKSGVAILRETAGYSPGILGEALFFANSDMKNKVNKLSFLQMEAEAYYKGIKEFFKKGEPKVKFFISVKPENSGEYENNNPIMAIQVDSGIPGVDVDEGSISVLMDEIRIPIKKIKPSWYLLDYGNVLYPCLHRFKVHFKNINGVNSMVAGAGVYITTHKGEYKELVNSGKQMIETNDKTKEGIRMLMAASCTDFKSALEDDLYWTIGNAFKKLGDEAAAENYFAKLYYYYPDNKHSEELEKMFLNYSAPSYFGGSDLSFNYKPDIVQKPAGN